MTTSTTALDDVLAQLDAEFAEDIAETTETVVEPVEVEKDLIAETLEETSELDALLESELDIIEGSFAESKEETKTDDDLSELDSLLDDIEGSKVETTDGLFPDVYPVVDETAPKAVVKDAIKDTKPSVKEVIADAKTKERSETGTFKRRARAAGEATPYDALATRLGGVKALESNVVLTIEDAEKSPEDLNAEFKEVINGLAKKVGAKAVNLMAHLQGCAKLECYTEFAMKILLEEGKLERSDLVKRLVARPYSQGTANSQTGQIMQLLPALKIANKVGSTLELNNDSVIVAALKAEYGIAAQSTNAKAHSKSAL